MKLRLKKPYHKEPHGGWHMVVDGTTFRAIGPDELVEKVRQYLLANGRPPRDIWRDLVMFCAPKWPHLVEPDYDNTPEPPVDPLARVMVRNAELSRRPLVNEPEKVEVKKRLSVCGKCPHNCAFRGPLASEIQRSSYILTKGKLESLGYCDAHGWDNRVAIQWDESILKTVVPEAVAGCWLSPQA